MISKALEWVKGRLHKQPTINQPRSKFLNAEAERRRLTAEERRFVQERVGMFEPGVKGIAWPEWAKQYNACNEPCDNWHGPCCCGAWHHNGS